MNSGSIKNMVNLHGSIVNLGARGYSNYEIAVQNGFEGSEQEWLDSLVGPVGPRGPIGPNNFHVGEEEPEDENVSVWLDTDEPIPNTFVPVATEETLGTIKPGNNLKVDKNGKLDMTIYASNVEEMVNSKLKPQDVVQTLGYYEPNDGGGALYLIREKTENDVEDKGSIYFVGDELVAELIIENNVINIKQLGGKSQDKNGKYDNKEYVDKYIAILQKGNSTQRRIKLYIPSGIWYFSPTDVYNSPGFYIYGDETFSGKGYEITGTIITSFEDNQSHLWIFGKDDDFQQNVVIKNINFSTSDFIFNDNNKLVFEKVKKVTDTVFRIKKTQYLISDNMYFLQIHGQALGISTSWEMYFKLLNFRGVTSENSVMNFEPLIDSNGNISACNFEKIMFEGFLNNLINVSARSGLGHCDFNTINIEDYQLGLSGFVENELVTSNSDFSNVEKGALFKFEENAFTKAITVNNILLNNFAHYIRTYNSKKYVFDSIIRCKKNNELDLLINNIQGTGILKDCDLIYTKDTDEGMVKINSIITINNCINNDTNYKMKFNLEGGFNGVLNVDTLNLLQPNVGGMNIKTHKFSFIEPLYKYVNNRYLSRALIFSDQEAINNTKLVVKPMKNSESTDTTFVKIPFYSKTLKIRAKIPEGETAIITYSLKTNDNKTVELVGTGAYKWYTLFENDTTYNDDSTITLVSNNLTCECLMDCIKFN